MVLDALEADEEADEAVGALLEEIERRRNPTAAALLAAIGALGREPVAAPARAGVERMSKEGIGSPLVSLVGVLAVDGAWRVEGDGEEMLLVLLRRPRTRRPQVAILSIEQAETGGALAACFLSPPLPAAEALPPWEDDDPELIVDAAEDEDGFSGTAALLLDELEECARQTVAPDSGVWRNGDAVASVMLDWKGRLRRRPAGTVDERRCRRAHARLLAAQGLGAGTDDR